MAQNKREQKGRSISAPFNQRASNQTMTPFDEVPRSSHSVHLPTTPFTITRTSIQYDRIMVEPSTPVRVDPVSSPRQHSRIAFGSCNDQSQYNALWPQIAARQPAAFIWGGDAIYADRPGPLDWSVFPPVPTHQCADPERLQRLYRQQQEMPGYRQLWQQNVTIFGTFDDHDFGCNNADRTYEYKYESGIAFVNFLQRSTLSPMHQRALAGHGVYGVQLLDFSRPQGQEAVSDAEAGIDADLPALGFQNPTHSNRTVAVFVLDVRTHKTPWRKDWPGRYQLDPSGDFLGERQWQWLEHSLQRSHAAIHIFVTGLQIHAYRFPDGNVAESWAQYPTAQQRLFDLVLAANSAAPLLISGDVHMAQLLRKDCRQRQNGEDAWTAPQRSLMELTTRYFLIMTLLSVSNVLYFYL
jgi:PhoD-like phosphatase